MGTTLLMEGPSRNMYKGHMTKAKGIGSKVGGRDGSGGGPRCTENEDNCT